MSWNANEWMVVLFICCLWQELVQLYSRDLQFLSQDIENDNNNEFSLK